MELTINNSVYTLKPLNSERRQLFATLVLSKYNKDQDNFDSFIEETRKILEEKHGISISSNEVKKRYFKELHDSLISCIWLFLFPSDKKDFKNKSDLDIQAEELQKFVEWGSKKINEYISYVKGQSKTQTNESIEVIYSYLAKEFGWTFEYMKEMDELELIKAIDQAIKLKEREGLDQINSSALAGAFASGSKKAKTQIDSMNRKYKINLEMNKIKKSPQEAVTGTNLSRADIEKIMKQKANGRAS